MPFLNNLKFGHKIGGGYAILMVLMIAISSVVYINVNQLITISGWVNHTYKVLMVAQDVQASVVNMETGQRGFLVTGEDNYLEPYHKGKENFIRLIKEGSTLTSDNPSQTARWKEVKQLKEKWLKTVADKEIAARRSQSNTNQDIAEMMSRGDGKLLMDTIRSKIDEIIAAEDVLIEVRAQGQKDESSFLISFTLIGTVIAIIIGSIISIFVTRGVVLPTNKMSEMLEKISHGDLTQRVPVNSNDEIGIMAASLNTFTQSLEDSIREVSSYTELLAAAAEELTAVTSQTSQGVEHQKMSTEQVAAAINEMSATVQEIARNANDASVSANEADTEARNGNQVVQAAITSINGLASEIESAGESIDTLKQNSVNIGSVLTVIMGIAEQTNLLALNAAIEAARAGEQGRGFAVVADEVRALAQRTQESTSEIETLIEALRNGATSSVQVMERSRHKAQETVQQATKAGDSLRLILKSVETIEQMNISIATATDQQSSVSEEINKRVHDIQQISENNSEGAEQTLTASNELSKLGVQLKDIVSRFKVS